MRSRMVVVIITLRERPVSFAAQMLVDPTLNPNIDVHVGYVPHELPDSGPRFYGSRPSRVIQARVRYSYACYQSQWIIQVGDGIQGHEFSSSESFRIQTLVVLTTMPFFYWMNSSEFWSDFAFIRELNVHVYVTSVDIYSQLFSNSK